MRLYYFTGLTQIHTIMVEGLDRESPPILSNYGHHDIILTTDPAGHGLPGARFPSPEELSVWGCNIGNSDQVPNLPDKTKVRITLDIAKPSMRQWSKALVSPDHGEAGIVARGVNGRARTWYSCDSAIEPRRFQNIEVRQDDNWDTLNNYTGSFVDTFSDDALIDGFSEWGAQLRIGRSRCFVLRLDEVLLARMMGLENCGAEVTKVSH